MLPFAAFPPRALALAMAFSLAPVASLAENNTAGIGRIEVADPEKISDGTVHPALRNGQFSPLPVSGDDAALQAALQRIRDEELRSDTPDLMRFTTASPREPDEIRSRIGLRYFNASPSFTTNAIGPTRNIQAVNELAAIFDRGLEQLNRSPLWKLAGVDSSIDTLNPKLIWDPHTNRYYYAMMTSAGADENRVAFGFSKNANPNNLTSNWCHYTYAYANRFLDLLSLGDNKHFIIFTGNAFQPGFVGADINAVSKPPPGTNCPDSDSFKVGAEFNIRDSGGVLASSPIAADQVDDLATGYVLARHGSGLLALPSNRYWLFSLTLNPTTGNPAFSSARQLTLAESYGVPAPATQPGATPFRGAPNVTLRTLDARPTQAVQARNPSRPAGVYSLWTQHTIGADSRSVVRWYEINPASNPPEVLRTGTIGAGAGSAGTFFFNAAISPDRAVNGASKRFGDSFVITYNVSSAANDINPGIRSASSVNGGPLTFRTIRNGVGPYHDLSCTNNGDVCNWGGASAAPDPLPDPDRPRPGRGVVWTSMQYSGDPDPRPDKTDWVTRIIVLQP